MNYAVKACSSWSLSTHCFFVHVISLWSLSHYSGRRFILLAWFPCMPRHVACPTLFSVFINDLPSVLPHDTTVLFADDTTIFIISDNLHSLNSTLQLTLDLANLWLERNGPKLNALKSKSMLIHSARKKINDELKLMIDHIDVDQVQCFKFLGSWLGEYHSHLVRPHRIGM